MAQLITTQSSSSTLWSSATADGKEFSKDDPISTDLITNANYKTVDMQLASFGLQIVDTCKRHCSNVLAGTNSLIKNHPFRQLIEWKLLELSFNLFKKSAEEQYFADLAELAAVPITLEFE
eukprot:439552-Rhodomonas_salina.1